MTHVVGMLERIIIICLLRHVIVIGVFDEGAGTPILGHFLCSISLYLKNYAVVGIYKINFDCSENNLH